MRWAAILLGLSLFACVRSETSEIPGFGEAKSAIVVARGPGKAVQVIAFDRLDRLAFNTDQDELEVLVLYYLRPLSEMSIVPGVIEQHDQALQRPLPVALRAAHGTLGGELDELDGVAASALELFREAKIIEPEPKDCLRGGGCYSSEEDQLCIQPCPTAAPVVERPRPLAPLPWMSCPWDPVLIPDGKYIPDEIKGLTMCEPVLKDSCTEDQLNLPGERACLPVTAACPANGVFAEGLPDEGVVYVDPAASGAQSGTRAAPFATIAQAVAVAAEGSTIALARGQLQAELVLSKSLVFRGACEQTVVHGTLMAATATIALRDLHFDAAGEAAIQIARSGVLDLSHVLYTSTATGSTASIFAHGKTRVRHVLFRAPQGRLTAMNGGHHVFRDFEVRGAQEGVFVGNGASLDAADGWIENRATSVPAIILYSGDAVLERLHLFGGDGLALSGTANVAARHLRIQAYDRIFRTGVNVIDQAVLSISESGIGPLVGIGMQSSGTSQVSMEGSVIGGIGLVMPGAFAHALSAGSGSQLSVTRTAIVVMEDNAVNIERGGHARFEDVVIGGMGDNEAAALIVRDSAEVHVERMIIVDSEGHGVRAKGDFEGPMFTARDLVIRNARGGGMEIAEQANVDAERVEITHAGSFGVYVYQAREVAFRELTIEDTYAAGGGPTCELACAGSGLHVTTDGHLTAESFVLQSCNTAGVRVSSNGSMALKNGVVRGSLQGVALDDRRPDLRSLLQDVLVIDNNETLVFGTGVD